jgi:hypothetical protein
VKVFQSRLYKGKGFMESLIMVQEIRTHWSKKSRGGKLATERNAVPDAVAIPGEKIKKPMRGLIEHSVAYNEWQGFSLCERSSLTQEPAGRVRLGRLLIEPIGEELHISFENYAKYEGMLIRPAQSEGLLLTRMRLQSRQWGRVLYNERFSYEEGWWFEKRVFNIGLFEKFEGDVFVSTKPAQVISQMAKLW